MKKRFLFSIIVSILVTGQALAAHDDGMTDKEKAVFDATTNKLKLPEVHYVDENGNMTTLMFAVDMDISKDVTGEALEFKITDLKQIDEHGCVFPETWHEAMGHCMDQTQ